jgi:anti-sigma factor RsiW
MTERDDRELLHGEIDGELTEAEASRLHEQLADDPAARARLEDLRTLTVLVESLGNADPPSGFVDDIIERVASGSRTRSRWAHWWAVCEAAIRHQLFALFPRHSQQRKHGGERFGWIAGWAGGGVIVAKKALWAVAGLAVVIILVVVYYNGTRTVNRGAEGTIGAADRYRGAQPSSADVAATQTAAQKFLQSDTFDRLIKDKNVRNLLGNRQLCALMTDADVLEALKDAQMVADLRKGGRAALADAEMLEALNNKRARAGLAEIESLEALNHKGTRAALVDVEFLEALKNAHRALADADFLEALQSKKAVKLASGEQQALADLKKLSKFKVAMEEGTFLDLMKSRAFLEALDEPTFLDLMKSQRGVAMLDDVSFMDLMKRDHTRFLQALDDVQFMDLMQKPEFLQAVCENEAFLQAFEDSGFQASLRLFDNLQAALRAKAQ